MTSRTNEVMDLEFGVSFLHAGVHLDAFLISLSHLGITNAGALLFVETHGFFYLH